MDSPRFTSFSGKSYRLAADAELTFIGESDVEIGDSSSNAPMVSCDSPSRHHAMTVECEASIKQLSDFRTIVAAMMQQLPESAMTAALYAKCEDWVVDITMAITNLEKFPSAVNGQVPNVDVDRFAAGYAELKGKLEPFVNNGSSEDEVVEVKNQKRRKRLK